MPSVACNTARGLSRITGAIRPAEERYGDFCRVHVLLLCGTFSWIFFLIADVGVAFSPPMWKLLQHPPAKPTAIMQKNCNNFELSTGYPQIYVVMLNRQAYQYGKLCLAFCFLRATRASSGRERPELCLRPPEGGFFLFVCVHKQT